MSVRTNLSPSFEFNEKDNSSVTIALNDVVSYVMGYAEKSEPYYPKYITTEQEFIKEFGTPSNEHEKYFYYACKSILDKNGTVLAARLPYDNDMEDNYKYYGYDTLFVDMSVSGIANGDNTPSLIDGTDFGDVGVGNVETNIFTIYNAGNSALNLTGSPIVELSGDSEFVVTTQPSSIVVALSTVTFEVTFTPIEEGLKTALVTIDNNDTNENPYTFTISASGFVFPTTYEYQEATFTNTPSTFEYIDTSFQTSQTIVEYEEVSFDNTPI